MKKYISILTLVILHIAAVVVIVAAFWPLAQWYFENPTVPASNVNSQARPLWGVDFYYTVTLVSLLKDNFVLPPTGWGYQWFTGWPLLSSYPILHYYFIVPFTHFFDLISAVKIWMLVSFALFFIGLYASFYLLSRNIAFAVVLAIAAIYSVGVYGTLMWGGSLPSHATQAFLPWVVFFLLLYLKKKRISYLLLASLLNGFAIWAHPQIVIAYIYPFAAILLVFSFWGMPLLSRIKSLFVFVGISFLIGLPLVYGSMGEAFKVFFVTNSVEVASSTARTPSATADAIAAFHRAQPARIYVDTNTTTFVFLAASFFVFLIVLLFKRQGKLLLSVLPFLVLALYSVVYVWIFSYGVSIYHGGWYRLFWVTPFWLGLLGSSFWGIAQESFPEKVVNLKHVRMVFLTFISFGIVIFGYISLTTFSKKIQERIIPRSTPSSAYPDILNLYKKNQQLGELKGRMIPSWIDGSNTHYRLYTGDQTINIWWNALYKMPLARGYLDPPVSITNKGYFFLVDASLNQQTGTGEDQLVGEFKYPEPVALNNTLYFVDWYAIKYIESGPTMAAYTPLPNSFSNGTYIKRDERIDFNNKKYNKGDMSLHYYEVDDGYTSPILLATNAPTLGIIASEIGYETIIRGLADMNLSSKQVIPIKLGQYIDRLKSSDFAAIDALIVYDYNYSDKGNAYRLLSDYLKKGKKLFIDTGVEVKEATSTDLPEIFPMNQSERKPLGKTWDFELGESGLMKDIDFSVFDPPIFDDQAWSITYPLDDSDVREGSTILLKNKGKPVMISYSIEGGQVIWSGINLPYHVIRKHNVEEVRFFKNIIQRLVDGTERSAKVPIYESEFINPQKRQVTTQGGKGILFKEQGYPGWRANAESSKSKENVKIYKAGPAYPGFMYVRLPENMVQKEGKITFSYHGSNIAWILSIGSFVLAIFITEEALFKGIILGRLRRLAWRKLRMSVNAWWRREDE